MYLKEVMGADYLPPGAEGAGPLGPLPLPMTLPSGEETRAAIGTSDGTRTKSAFGHPTSALHFPLIMQLARVS